MSAQIFVLELTPASTNPAEEVVKGQQDAGTATAVGLCKLLLGSVARKESTVIHHCNSTPLEINESRFNRIIVVKLLNV